MRRLLGMLGLALLVGGCSGTADDPATGEPDPVIETSTTVMRTTTEPSAVDLPDNGEWETIRPAFEIDGFSDSVEGNRAGVRVVEAAAGAYWAAGNLNGRPTIWRGDDLTSFSIVYHDDWTPRGRWIQFTSIVAFDGHVVVGGPGRVQTDDIDDDLERSFLFSSADDGTTWTEHDFDWLTDEGQRLDRMITAGDALLVDLVNDECCERPRWMPLRATDLATWEPLALPDAETDTWGRILSDGSDHTWVIAPTGLDEPVMSVWESTDGGATWAAQPTATLDPLGIVPIDGSLFFTTRGTDHWFGPGHAEPAAPRRLVDGMWRDLPVDVGQWGDGDASVEGRTNDRGRFYGIASRVRRASVHYCYVDVEACQQPVTRLVTSDNGIDWHDVIGPDFDRYERPSVLFTLDGRPVLWRDDDSAGRRLTVWTGADEPPTRDPNGYDPPDVPVPMLSDEPLEIGDERRYAWGLGGCGGMYIDGIDWLPEVQPDTAGWPILPFNGADGPTGWALGRVLRIADDQIQFWIEGDDVRHDFRPRVEEPEYFCG